MTKLISFFAWGRLRIVDVKKEPSSIVSINYLRLLDYSDPFENNVEWWEECRHEEKKRR